MHAQKRAADRLTTGWWPGRGQHAGKSAIGFSVPQRDPRFDIRFSHPAGKLKVAKGGREDVTVSVLCRASVSTVLVAVMEVEGALRRIDAIGSASSPP